MLVLIRFGLRGRRQGGGFGLDDAFLLPSWMFATAFVALAVWSSHHGLIDRHIWDIPPSELPTNILNAYLATIVFLLGSCSIKLSILFFHRRLQLGTYNPKWKLAIYLAIAFTATYTTALLLNLFLACRPVDAYWKAFDPMWTAQHQYHCANTAFINVAAGVVSVVGDAYAVALPCAMLQGLQMPTRQKIGLYAVFAMGLGIVGAGCVRTYVFHRLRSEWDITWIGFWIYFWSILEFELGIICACLPSLRIFVKRCLQSASNSHASRLPSSDRERLTDFEASGSAPRTPQPVLHVTRFLRMHGPRSMRDEPHKHMRSEKKWELFRSSNMASQQSIAHNWEEPPFGVRTVISAGELSTENNK